MKKRARPRLDSRWWAKNKAKTLAEKKLGPALETYEARIGASDWKGALKALKAVKDAVHEAMSKCTSADRETLDVLQRYPRFIDERAAEIRTALRRKKAEENLDFTLAALGVAVWKSKGDNSPLIPYLDALIKGSSADRLEYRTAVKSKLEHLRKTEIKLLKDAIKESTDLISPSAGKALASGRAEAEKAADKSLKLIADAEKIDDAKKVRSLYKQIRKQACNLSSAAEVTRMRINF